MTDPFPPTGPPAGPPASYDGDYSRPLDPQFVDPQYGRAPLYPPMPTSPMPTSPMPPPPVVRRSSRRNVVALAVLGGLVIVLALVLAVLSVSEPEETRGLEVLPTDPVTPAPSVAPTEVPDLQATVVGVRFFDALDTGDQVEIEQLECAGFDATVPLDLADATPSGAATVDGAAAAMNGSVLLTDGTGYDLTLTMRRQGTSWCVSGLTKR